MSREYAAHRPSYPAAAIDYLVEGMVACGLRCADIGAGTGISSRLLADRGAHVVAVEPNAAMRAAAKTHPLVTWQPGDAGNTGLRAMSADLACAFQAFQWFATLPAVSEMRRILVPGGRVAIVLNERDEGANAATRWYGDVIRRLALDDTEARRLESLEFFANIIDRVVKRAEFSWERSLNLAQLLGLAASSSYLPHSGDGGAELERSLRQLFEEVASDGIFTLGMRTIVLRADVAKK